MASLGDVNAAAKMQLELSEQSMEIHMRQADQVISNAARLVAISGTESLQKKVASYLWPSSPPSPEDAQTPPSELL